jgi:addiction module HigA family antidote
MTMPKQANGSPFKTAPPKPGIVLRNALTERGIKRGAFIKATGCDQKWFDNFCSGTIRMTAGNAIRFGRYFGTSPEYWMNMQRDVELYEAYQRIKD